MRKLPLPVDSGNWTFLQLLDRVELPPAHRIPNDREVEAAGLTQWTIPNTRLTMARLQEGPVRQRVGRVMSGWGRVSTSSWGRDATEAPPVKVDVLGASDQARP
jgi:hypothetical protein